MDHITKNQDNNDESVVKIDHNEDQVTMEPSDLPLSDYPGTETSFHDEPQQTAGIGSSSISSKYADEIKEIGQGYSEKIEDRHAQNFHGDNQQTAPRESRDLFSSSFQVPSTTSPTEQYKNEPKPGINTADSLDQQLPGPSKLDSSGVYVYIDPNDSRPEIPKN